MTVARTPVLLITGPVGVGKTTIANEVSALLEEAAMPHACVDMDQLRCAYPRPPDDRFNSALGLRNLGDVWANYHAAGARRLILADVLESRANLLGYEAAIPGADILVVRLRASVASLAARVQQREVGAGLDWHLRRSAELAAQMEREGVEDIVVETDGRGLAELAREVLERSGWVIAPGD